jgi:carbon monoxide dehydrogenase subunit G
MKLEQSFEIKAPLEKVWEALIDVERVAPCLPGAEVTGRGDDGAYEGTFQVKLGPTTAAYRGTLRMVELDEAGRVATMSANAQEKRGGGSAKATMVSTMSEAGEATKVDVQTDFTLTGRLARFGRGGMIQDVSNRLLRDFSECLQRTLEGEGAEAAVGAPSAPAAPNAPSAPAATITAVTPATAGPNGGRADATLAESPGTEVAGDDLASLRAEVAALRRDVDILKARAAASAPPAKPINAFSLLLSVLRERVARLFSRGG